MANTRQTEIDALRRNARQYEDAATGHWDVGIAEALRTQAQKFREQADELEKKSGGA